MFSESIPHLGTEPELTQSTLIQNIVFCILTIWFCLTLKYNACSVKPGSDIVVYRKYK